MKIRAVLSATTVAVALTAVTTAFAPARAADPAVLKIGSFTPPKAKYLQEILIPWLRKIEADSAGSLKFQEFWGGSLIRSPRKQWEGLVNGIQDASQILPSYTAKLFPDFTFFDLPFLFRGVGSVEATTVGWKMFERGLLGGLEKVHVLAVYANDNGGLHFNRSIEKLDGVKGLKVRVVGPKQSAVVKVLGLVPVGMGAPQVAESLNRGVIDGALMGWSAISIFRITPLIKSHLDLPLGVRSFFIAVREPAYEKLPQKAKDALAKNRGLEISLKLGGYYQNDGETKRTKLGERTKIDVSEAEMNALSDRFEGFHKEWIGNSPKRAKMYKAIREILADYRKTN